MSAKYRRLIDLLGRESGLRSDEGCRELGVSPATYRGMLRDVRKLVPLERITLSDRRRASYRLAGSDGMRS